MARPNKFDLQYFPLDVNCFDDHKMINIEQEGGIQAGYIALRLWAMAYSDKGYYLEWPDKFEYTVAKRISNGVLGSDVLTVLQLCMKHKLFDERKFRKFAIITSAGIQRRWLAVMTISRRKIQVNDSYWVLTSEETGISSEETTPPDAKSTQKEKKGNNTKGKILKQKNSSSRNYKGKKATQDAGPEKFIPPTEQECIDYILERKHKPKEPGSWTHGRCTQLGAKFFKYNNSKGWKGMVIWKDAAEVFIINEAGSGSTGPAAAAPKPAIRSRESAGTAIEKAMNYLYQRFLEDPAAVTYASVEVSYYDRLVTGGIKFPKDIQEEIRLLAIAEMDGKQITATADLLKIYMAKFAVIEYFKMIKEAGNTIIFNLKQ